LGIKIVKNIFLAVILSLLLCVESFASGIVRVCISDSSFKDLSKNNVIIYSTDECEIYTKKDERVIGNVQAYTDISVTSDINGFLVKIGQKPTIRVADDIIITSPSGLVGTKTVTRKSQPALYRGYFEIVKKINTDRFYLVNVVDVENYLLGVVPNEMPVRFGLEALKAQAIAARNYALSDRLKAYKEFDLTDTVASQVYFGANSEMPLATQAVNETSGLLALYEDVPILALYCSTAGGYTESYNYAFSEPNTKDFPSKPIPYLVAKADMLTQLPLNEEENAVAFYKNNSISCYDMKSPYFRWQRTWDAEELRKILEKTLNEQSPVGFIRPEFKTGRNLGNIKELKVVKRGYSGKIVEMEIVTDSNNYHVYKEITIRRLFKKDGKALPSANMVFEHIYNPETDKLEKVIAYGGGYGHGVGMSQYGAGFMGIELKKSYDEIIRHYYSGVNIGTNPIYLGNEEISQIFYTKHPDTSLVICNPQVKLQALKMNINDEDVEISIPVQSENKKIKVDISNYIKKGENKIIFYPIGCEPKLKLYVELVEKDGEYYF